MGDFTGSGPRDTDGPTPAGPRFEDAVRNAVEGLRESIAAFEALLAEVPEDAYSDAEWKVIEGAAAEMETLAEQVRLEYDVVGYDGQAWYDIMQDLPRVTRMLGDTMVLMREARERHRRAGRTGS